MDMIGSILGGISPDIYGWAVGIISFIFVFLFLLFFVSGIGSLIISIPLAIVIGVTTYSFCGGNFTSFKALKMNVLNGELSTDICSAGLTNLTKKYKEKIEAEDQRGESYTYDDIKEGYQRCVDGGGKDFRVRFRK